MNREPKASVGVPLRAVKVQGFANGTPSGLATAINSWITANAGQRTMLTLTFTSDTAQHAAFLTFTE
jgi:hypothetical protein